MSGRRKHRVIVEVTFDKRVTAEYAKKLIGYHLEELQGSSCDGIGPVCEKFEVKEAERVIQAEINWKNRK